MSEFLGGPGTPKNRLVIFGWSMTSPVFVTSFLFRKLCMDWQGKYGSAYGAELHFFFLPSSAELSSASLGRFI